MARRFDETVNIQPQSLSTGGAQALLSLADRLEGFKQQQIAKAGQQAIQRGVESAQQVELGRAQVEGREVTQAPEMKEKRFIGGVEVNAHNKALQSAYLASLNNDNREAIANIAAENPDDVKSFNDAASGYMNGVLAGVDPAVRQLIAEDLDNKVTSARIKIHANELREQKIQANAERMTNIENGSSAAYRAARNGDSAESANNLEDVFATIDSMVDSGDLKVDRANSMKREIEREATEQGIRKNFDDIVDGEGFDAAYDELEAISKKVPKGWTPDEWDSFTADQHADLNRKRARAEFEAKEAASAVTRQASIERGMLFMDRNIPADPAKSGQDRKDVNAAYEFESQKWANLPPQELINKNVEFIQGTGIVPDGVISAVNAAMRSGSTDQVMMTGDLVARIQEMPNASAALRDLPDESRAISIQVADSVRAGIEPEMAVEIARKNTFGLTAQQRELIKINTQAVAKELPSMLADQVDDKFDPSITPFFGEEPDVPPSMQADYNVAFEKFMTMTDGNPDQAKTLAFDSIQKTWAITDVGGDNRFMKSAPEAFYSVPGFDNEWIDRQFLEDMELKGVEGAMLGTDFNTGRSETPSYPILVVNDRGILDTARDDETGEVLRWRPDFRQTEDFAELQAAPGEAIESAKKKRARKLTQRANYLRRNVNRRVKQLRNIKQLGAEDDSKPLARSAINNLLATRKIDEVEAKELLKAYDAGSIDDLPAFKVR